MPDESPFRRYLAELLGLIGGELPDDDSLARDAALAGLPEEGPWPEAVSGAVMRVIVNDSFPVAYHPLLKLAVRAAGHRVVQEALIATLETGTNAEKVRAAQAWYWAQPPLVYRGLAAMLDGTGTGTPTPESQREHDALSDLRVRWRQAVLREFVANEDPDLRHSLRESLSLDPSDYPAGFTGLVTKAAGIARRC